MKQKLYQSIAICQIQYSELEFTAKKFIIHILRIILFNTVKA